MLPIFIGLAVSNTILLVLTIVAGVQFAEAKAVFGSHFSAALFTGIFTLLVHCIVFTYFVGTGKWVKETISNGVLKEEEWLPKITDFKRKVFPINTYAMLFIIGTAILGAWAYGGGSPLAAGIHKTFAYITVVVNVFSFRIEGKYIRQNTELLNRAVAIKEAHIEDEKV